MSDLISKQAAIDALLDERNDTSLYEDDDTSIDYADGYEEGINNACVIIEQLPPTQPERKKGRWINVRGGNSADCDQCKCTGRAWMNYCPNCGADMRGGNHIWRNLTLID